jgi:hypothetical protein
MSKIDELDDWIAELIYPGDKEKFIQIIRHIEDEEQEIKEIAFYTKSNKYRIFANDRKNKDGYLGCQVSARKSRAGEDWIRGNDLPDGKFNHDTWNLILKSIISYELIQLSDYTKSGHIPEGGI